MQIIIKAPHLETIEDYSCWRGTLDAIKGEYSKSLFSFHSTVAAELRAIYETAFYLEQESQWFEDDCDFEVTAVIHSYNDNTGWGLLYSDNFLGLVDFSYTDLTWDDFVSQGEHVTVRFKKQCDGKIKIINIKRQV